jgi:hypothetical protein
VTGWKAAWWVAFIVSASVLFFHCGSPGLLHDTDTSVLLTEVSKRHSVLSWFWTDWPLHNHFYRPIPTLTFILDHCLYGMAAQGYGWTNAFLGSACVFALFWMLRELTNRPSSSILGVIVFALWQTDSQLFLGAAMGWIAYGVLILGAIRHRSAWKNYIPAFVTILFVQYLLIPLAPLRSVTLDWLPGRTATTMTLFALLAMASYARHLRLGARSRSIEKPTSMDRPATRNTRIAETSSTELATLAVLTLLFTTLALASYEQAVMLPACLLGVAIFFALSGKLPNWKLQIPIWSLLGLYLLLRHSIIPTGESSYQAQQLRSGFGGTQMSLLAVSLPFFNDLSSLWENVQDQGLLIFFSGGIYALALNLFVVFGGIYQLRREWRLAFTGWALCALSFLPMAFLKPFNHYYYWPMAMRSILVIAAFTVAFNLAVNALSPPAQQAPRRLRPAPGSLPDR